ncbi:UNVERIFIED_CONTAM: RPM1-interacting protein 4 [Sesamum calycinum]|uniref:RPM1-interacting protein 4 n=1 Tax=Sesamum calycinum TaxID=2727403 RepID=A0AAW2Q5W0_9LAMI
MNVEGQGKYDTSFLLALRKQSDARRNLLFSIRPACGQNLEAIEPLSASPSSLESPIESNVTRCFSLNFLMAQRSHVPKFGNWDGDNVPYTAYFENARKDKAGGTMINPNDPEQNPDAFNIGGARGGSSNFTHAVPASARINPDKQMAREKYGHQRHIYDQHKSTSSKTVASESSSDKSPSDSSVTPVLRPSHRRKKSDRSKYTSYSHVPPSPGLNQSDDFSPRAVSVPRFGQWDENDPRSAEGFTVIFNRVKEEKQIAAAKFPPVPLQNFNNHQASQEKETKSKKCCGLF